MPYYQTWEEFARAAEKLYLTAPMKVRVVIKYRHCDGNLRIKVTDDAVAHTSLRSPCATPSVGWSGVKLAAIGLRTSGSLFSGVLNHSSPSGSPTDKSEFGGFQCLQYKTDQAQDVKKIEKLHGKLMRLMVSKESGAMETD
uniref:SRP9 domain-containing protein n=1 Tax=Oncorhynchus tshawytscha TaxID=74940 RepID=A0A8C8F7I9_ONCTS